MDLTQLQHPFEAICVESVSTAMGLYDTLQLRMRPPWNTYPLVIEFVDDGELNAFAQSGVDSYRIAIHRGAIEHIFGAFYCLLCCPNFLPLVGDLSAETTPEILHRRGLLPLPIRKSEVALWNDFPCPNNPVRQSLALTLATNAFEFLIFHEIGHVVAGHLEMIAANGEIASISEVESSVGNHSKRRRACECDADLFATDVTTFVAIDDRMAKLTNDFYRTAGLSELQVSQLLQMVAVGTLFRILFPMKPRGIAAFNGNYPHPAVRAGIGCSYSNAIAMHNNKISYDFLNDLYFESLVNLEDVWADLQLKGQLTAPRENWAADIQAGMKEELANCAQYNKQFEEFAHLPRRWSCW